MKLKRAFVKIKNLAADCSIPSYRKLPKNTEEIRLLHLLAMEINSKQKNYNTLCKMFRDYNKLHTILSINLSDIKYI